MYNPIVVDKGRTNVITADVGFDASSDTLVSEIRTKADVESTLIAAWTVDFTTDGSDGLLTLTLDDSVTSVITQSTGYMDIKRITGGEPVSVFAVPLQVVFQGTVTE